MPQYVADILQVPYEQRLAPPPLRAAPQCLHFYIFDYALSHQADALNAAYMLQLVIIRQRSARRHVSRRAIEAG